MSFSGTQKIGNRNYISPTFDLCSPTQNIGYIYTTDVYTGTNIEIIRIASIDSINVDNNIYVKYCFDINTTIAGSNEVEVFSYSLYYCPYMNSKTAFYYHDSNKDKFNVLNKSGIKNDSDKIGMYARVTKVGAIGEYIEGTYKLYNYNPPVLHITHGRFKVLRVAPPTI